MLNIINVNDNSLEDFLTFLRSIALWLNETDRGMWRIEKLGCQEFLRNNKVSDCYLGYIGDAIATAVILTEENSFMWPDINSNETLFVGKLGVSRNYAGKGYAKEMLDFAYSEGIKRNKKYLRLDCYADREYLCKLYENFGFKLVRKREMMPNLFAALYELKL